MKESIYLSTPEHAKLEFELAGLASRFLAHAIDLLVIGFILTCLSLLLFLGPFASLVRDTGAFDSYGIAVMILLSFSILWGYYFLLEGFFQGVTPGKKMMGIRVLREDGMPIGFYESAIRNLVRAADAFPPPDLPSGWHQHASR
ncbi:RDD family protein [Verrucomicrobia bacterium]|nr:RDD family protein [Verrucomicrobiota bacterium]